MFLFLVHVYALPLAQIATIQMLKNQTDTGCALFKISTKQ